MKRQASVVLAWLAVGCGYGGESSDGPYDDGYVCGEPRESLIDTGAELELEAGEGVGLLMEYLGDGEWHVRTSCDTLQSGYECGWDVSHLARQGTTLSDLTGEDLEAGDALARDWDGALHLSWFTGADIDGVTFEATRAAHSVSTRCSIARARTRTCTGSATEACTPGHRRTHSTSTRPSREAS